MLKFIAHLRTKPERVRKHVALLATATLSVIILLMWWVSFSISPDTAHGISVSEAISPAQGIFSAFGETWESVKQQFNTMGTEVYKGASTTETATDTDLQIPLDSPSGNEVQLTATST